MSRFRDEIRSQLGETARLLQSFPDDLIASIETLAVKAAAALQQGHKIVFFGNGGSAADAQHLAAELVVRLHANRKGLAALSLATNTSVLTAAGNDLGFEFIFARQIESLVNAGDVLVALSTSGTSPNIVRGVEAGKGRGAFLVGMTGQTGGALRGKVDLLLAIPSQDAQRIQEAHISIGHVVCSLIERICCPELGA
jgi:D-sedoheptulose 7-phosphate isomerase